MTMYVLIASPSVSALSLYIMTDSWHRACFFFFLSHFCLNYMLFCNIFSTLFLIFVKLIPIYPQRLVEVSFPFWNWILIMTSNCFATPTWFSALLRWMLACVITAYAQTNHCGAMPSCSPPAKWISRRCSQVLQPIA